VIEFESEIRIERPAADVFSFVADQENNPKWNYFVTHVRKTSTGPLGPGTTFHQTRKSDEQNLRMVAFEPDKSITVETIPPSKPEVIRTITFQDDDGATTLVDHWKLDSGHPGFLQRLAGGRVKSAVRENLTKLKELLESGSTTLQDGRRVTL